MNAYLQLIHDHRLAAENRIRGAVRPLLIAGAEKQEIERAADLANKMVLSQDFVDACIRAEWLNVRRQARYHRPHPIAR